MNVDKFVQQVEAVHQHGAALRQRAREAAPPHLLDAAYDAFCAALAELDAAKHDLLHGIVQRSHVEHALRESEERFRSLVQNSSDIITVLGADGTIVYESPSIERILGYHPTELIGHNVFALVHPDDQFVAHNALARALQTPDGPHYLQCRFLHRDGSWRYLESVGANRLDWPMISGIVVNSRDITDRWQAEQALRDEEERFRQLAEHIQDALWMKDVQQNRLIYISPAYNNIWGRSSEQLLADHAAFFDFIHPEDRARVRAIIAQQRHSTYEVEYRIVHPHGDIRWIWERAFPIRNAQGEVYRIAGIAKDITERKRSEAQLHHQALHDALTGLPNRALFMNHLKQALARHKRHPEYAFAVLFFDLDRFKQVNDSLGHPVGDQLLVGIAQRLASCLRPNDTVARLGGDEFVILLDGLTGVTDATQIADRIQHSLAQPFHLNGHDIVTTTSIGIALSTTTAYTHPQDLLRDANIAMYRAKAGGKARYAVFDQAMHAYAVALFHLERDLRRAVERHEFDVHYQPIVSLANGQVLGVEALLRWQHPERGTVLPSTFIHLAEETGLIVPIGDWMMRTVCAQTRAWQIAHQRSLFVAINLSARQFQHTDLSANIGDILADVGFDAQYLKLELTESSLIERPDMVATTLQALRNMGVHLLIDDFGTGYSSLSHLKHFPIDTLKIDQSFVRGITTNADDAAIVTATIAMAHSLHRTVIAEGVETHEQIAFLQKHGCDAIQGYVVGPPMPADAFTQHLGKHSPAAVSARGTGAHLAVGE